MIELAMIHEAVMNPQFPKRSEEVNKAVPTGQNQWSDYSQKGPQSPKPKAFSRDVDKEALTSERAETIEGLLPPFRIGRASLTASSQAWRPRL